MTDTMTSQDIDLSSWDTLYILWCYALLDDGISPSIYQCGVHLTCLSPTLAGTADDSVLMSVSLRLCPLFNKNGSSTESSRCTQFS